MADQELWRKNIPEDFQGKMGEHWDDEINIKVIYWSAAAIAGSVAIAFGLCWVMMGAPLNYLPEKYFGFEVQLSPLDEANARRLPPSPQLQPKPEIEMDELLEEMDAHLGSYGWNDQLNGVVHIPVDRAMELMASSFPAPGAVEPTLEEPVDVTEPAHSDAESHGDEAADPGSEAVQDHSAGEAQG